MKPEEFKQARIDLGFSQSEMAKHLGIKNSRTIRRYESGDWKVSQVIIAKLKNERGKAWVGQQKAKQTALLSE